MARSQAAYDRFAAATDGPMMVATTFATIDYTVWALFAVEYLAKLGLASNRKKYFRTHIFELIIVAVPFFRPARLGRLVDLGRLGRIGIVTADILDRGKRIMTHKGLHSSYSP